MTKASIVSVLLKCANDLYGHSDPCCGAILESRYRTRGAVNDPAYCLAVPSNPCNPEPNGTANCFIARKKNRDFANLATNNFNTSCDCTSLRDGFTWNEDAKMCVGWSEHNQPLRYGHLYAELRVASVIH